tara:strand:+ start:1241 stop:1612 length:372 start_codon:yes stop_codon:yes gene_type:complete
MFVQLARFSQQGCPKRSCPRPARGVAWSKLSSARPLSPRVYVQMPVQRVQGAQGVPVAKVAAAVQVTPVVAAAAVAGGIAGPAVAPSDYVWLPVEEAEGVVPGGGGALGDDFEFVDSDDVEEN